MQLLFPPDSTLAAEPAAHVAIHELAQRTGCRCPACGDDPARDGESVDEVADEALSALAGLGRGAAALGRAAGAANRVAGALGSVGRGARAAGVSARRVGAVARSARVGSSSARAGRLAARASPAAPRGYTGALQGTLQSLGWRGFGPYGSRQINMQLLRNFHRAGGTQAVGQGRRQHVQLTPEGVRLLRDDPRFASLQPLFQRQRRTDIYRLSDRDQPDRNLYIGKTNRPPALRLLEHLLHGRSTVGRRLRQLQHNNQLGTVRIDHGQFNAPDAGRRGHLVEVLLQEMLNPAWNDPSRHGFDM